LLCLRPAAHFAPVHSRARDNDFHDLFTPDEHTQERADSNRQQQRRPGVACASIGSPIGEAYLGAMRAAINGKRMRLFVHRKGATRAFGPGHPAITENLKKTGQPVLIGGTKAPPRIFYPAQRGVWSSLSVRPVTAPAGA
jgi:hypothetical protein